jgi:putative Holliday junction resolvase
MPVRRGFANVLLMRYMALDLGDKRTGVAVGDSITGLATPVEVLQVPVSERGGAALLEAIGRAVEEHIGRGGQLVVGLPLNMDGTEGARAKAVRALAERIGAATGCAVHFQDERLTSASAEWSLARSGLTHRQKKERRDAVAAAAILSDFLAARSRQPGSAEPG